MPPGTARLRIVKRIQRCAATNVNPMEAVKKGKRPITDTRPESVKTGRTNDEVKADPRVYDVYLGAA